MRGFIFDLDGCVWTGDVLVPGAADVLALLRSQGRALTFLTNNSRARAGGAAFLTPNLDPRLPVEGDDFLPGCGAIVEAVAAAGCVRPLVVGKPEPPLFELALARMQLEPAEAAMVGDSVDSDIRGARRVGLTAVLLAPKGALDGVAHYMVKSMAQLKRLVETYNP